MNTKTPAKPAGRMIRDAREAKGWLQADLAEATDLNQGYISQIETGARTPTRKVARLIAMALGMSNEERDELLERVTGPLSSVTSICRQPRPYAAQTLQHAA